MSCSHRKIEPTFPHALFSLRQSNPRRPLAGSSPNEAIHPLVASTLQNEANPHLPHRPFREEEQNEATEDPSTEDAPNEPTASPSPIPPTNDQGPMTNDDEPNEPTASPLPWQLTTGN